MRDRSSEGDGREAPWWVGRMDVWALHIQRGKARGVDMLPGEEMQSRWAVGGLEMKEALRGKCFGIGGAGNLTEHSNLNNSWLSSSPYFTWLFFWFFYFLGAKSSLASQRTPGVYS